MGLRSNTQSQPTLECIHTQNTLKMYIVDYTSSDFKFLENLISASQSPTKNPDIHVCIWICGLTVYELIKLVELTDSGYCF